MSYTELINHLKTPKLLKGSVFKLSICLVNDNVKVYPIEVVLHFRINKNET